MGRKRPTLVLEESPASKPVKEKQQDLQCSQRAKSRQDRPYSACFELFECSVHPAELLIDRLHWVRHHQFQLCFRGGPWFTITRDDSQRQRFTISKDRYIPWTIHYQYRTFPTLGSHENPACFESV